MRAEFQALVDAAAALGDAVKGIDTLVDQQKQHIAELQTKVDAGAQIDPADLSALTSTTDTLKTLTSDLVSRVPAPPAPSP